MAFPTPTHEALRQFTLDCSGAVLAEENPRLDALTQHARARFHCAISVVSLVDRARQFFVSKQGLEESETPRDVAFCAHTITLDEPLIVDDARRDPRFADNPLVTSEPHIRFYAGAPIILDGQPLGSFCVIDEIPRHNFSAVDICGLQAYARLAAFELERSRALRNVDQSIEDQLSMVEVEIEQSERHRHEIALREAERKERPLRSALGHSNCIRTLLKNGASRAEIEQHLDQIEAHLTAAPALEHTPLPTPTIAA